MRTGDLIARRYRLEEQLGSGAGGVVWTAFDTKLKRIVALKRPHAVRDDAQRAQFRQEAETSARLHHPNAVGVFDTVDTDGCWLVMEYLPSRSLDALLADRGPLPPEAVARIGAQVAAALHAAHQSGIVHRDVKPGNVLVTEDGVAKLTDFGISIWSDATLTEDAKISGTAAYVAPEVANGEPATRASDVFSLGATLFAAVEGAPPFGTGDPESILARARQGHLPGMRRAGPLAPVLSELLSARPARRPTAEQARRRLRAVAGDWEEPAPGPHPIRVPVWRRPPYRIAVGVVAAAIVAAGVAAWAPSGSTPPAARPAGAATDVPASGAPGGGSGAPAGGPSGGASGGPAATADPIGDPRTADPCAMAGQAALRRWGTTSLDPEYGNFDRCDVLVDTGGEDPVDVEVELATPETPRKVRPGAFAVQRDPLSDDECDRRVTVTDDYDVWITAKVDDPKVDLCAMADAGTTAAVAALRKGPLPRRAPFNRASLANADACALLDGKALAGLPGVDAIHPEVGYGNWDCRWNSTIDQTSLHILFDHSQPMTADDGTPTRLDGHAAFVAPDDYEDHSCSAKVVNRQVTDLDGTPLDEVMVVVVSGDGPGKQYCSMATDFAAAAVPNLPH